MRMRNLWRAPALGALVFGLTTEVQASCGLDQCPADPSHESHLLFSLGAKQVGYDLAGQSGDYRLALLRAEAGAGHWQAGLWLGLVDLDSPAGTRRGMTNPTLFLQRQLGPADARWSVQLGTQLELPFGTDETAIRSDHTEWMPYARLALSSGRWLGSASLGWRESIGDDEADGGVAPAKHAGETHGELLVVAPHSSREMAGRLALGARLNARGAIVQLSLDGQRVLADGEPNDHFQLIGLALDWPIGLAWQLTPSLELPFGDTRRFESAFGLRVQRTF